MYPQDFLFIFHGFLCFLVYGKFRNYLVFEYLLLVTGVFCGSSISHTRRGLGAGVTQVVDFDCPEEFGYYPHPTDCTQYYVCVFGGALLESCTGGLMYSHELQTCDWPRNVGCGESNSNGHDGSTISTVRVTDPRTRNPQQSSAPVDSQQSQVLQSVTPRGFQRQDYNNRSRQHDVIQQQFYNEEIGPAEEIEPDRQQRVYRGQPSSLGNVQRDRDGLRQLKTNVHTPNVIPASTNGQDKISVVSFGSQRPSPPRPQEQYRNLTDCLFNTIDDDGDDGRTDDLMTEKKSSLRTRRQVVSRTGYLQTNGEPFSFLLVSPGTEGNRQVAYVTSNIREPVRPVLPSPFARPLGFYNIHPTGKIIKMSKPNIQTGFKPMLHYPNLNENRWSSAETVQQVQSQTLAFSQTPGHLGGVPEIRFVTHSPFVPQTTTITPKTSNFHNQELYSVVKFVPSPLDTRTVVNATTYRNPIRYLFAPSTTLRNTGKGNVTPSRYYSTTPRSDFSTTKKPYIHPVNKPVNYLPHWLDAGKIIYGGEGKPIKSELPYIKSSEHKFADWKIQPIKTLGENGHKKGALKGNYSTQLPPKEEYKSFIGLIKDIRDVVVNNPTPLTEMTSQRPGKSLTIKGFYVTEETPVGGVTNTEQTTTSARKEVAKVYPIGLHTTLQPPSTETLYPTLYPAKDDDDDDFKHSLLTPSNRVVNRSRIEQVQAHHLTSALPPQTPSPRPIERYNTSSRFQPDQYDQYYAVYDDVDIYRQNVQDYNQPQYQTPSSTPSSNIAHQYRGSTTHKQAVELERAQEPVQQQQHRNAYAQDIYSPPPALQDFNDQYNVQIDDQQQYQHLAQSTPKHSSRSEKANGTTDSLSESTSTTVTRAPENATAKYEPPSSPIIRRSDSNSYFSLPSFGPSTVLLPPLRYDETTRKYFDSDYSTTTKNEKQLYSSLIPALREGSRNSFEPPKNGGALAKTFNSFDSLLSSFIAAVTNPNARPTSSPSPSTTPPTPEPPKSSPETIVRSEIGRIHHDPIVITENFTIRLPHYRKPEETKTPLQTTLVVPLPPPSSTPVPPPALAQNDYLAYFVEIEPKKPKEEDSAKRNGFYAEQTTDSKPLNTESGSFRAGSFEPKPKPYSDFVRLSSNGQNQKVQLGASLDLEPIDKPSEGWRPIIPETEKDKAGSRGYQPIGKWVIAKDGKSAQYPGTVRPGAYDTYDEKRQRGSTNLPESAHKEKGKEPEVVSSREIENLVQNQPITEAEVPPTTIVTGPYKFLYVDIDSTTEELSSPSPFGRNPENEERNRFSYKTNPESRVRGRFYEKERETSPRNEPESKTEVPASYNANFNQNYGTDDSIKYIYKTDPESRFRNRFLGNSEIVVDDKKSEEPEVTPKIIVPELVKIEEKDEGTVPFRQKPIQVLPNLKAQEVEVEEEEESEEEDEPETVERDQGLTRRRKPEIRFKSGDVESSSRKPIRYKSTTESQEVDSEPETDEGRKSPPRRIVKVQLKNQRLPATAKVKRLRKPTTKSPSFLPSSPSPSPIIVLEELEEKTLSKENEIHPGYRPIVVTETLFPAKNRSRFRFTVEDERDFGDVRTNKIGFSPSSSSSSSTTTTTTEKLGVKSGFVPISDAENDLPEREVPDSGKPFSPIVPKRPLTLKNVTSFENRATTKAYRGKFKPSDSFKLRLKPTTASPDSESTPGPHLSTRGPGAYTIGNTGNEVTVNRGTPVPNRGTRPTLKPSTAIVSKASEFIDIYRYPPRRPQNLYATPTPDKSAAKCRKDVCLLPDCNCGGKDIPGGFSAEEIPQLVLLTFDDSVNDLNKGLYADLFERGRVNPNGCPISATFYVSHEWTDYSQVQNLYANGHEIASHSITHSFGEQFSQKKWTKEIAGQREILAAYGGVRLEDIRGMRAPFLAVGGNKMFKMLYDSNFTYDSSMPIYENRPPSWPYTLDYKLFHDCMIPPCPTKSYPGVWEVPMVMWQDLNGGRCSMGDACSNPPTADGVYKMLIKNFERHFTTNRAPFGLYYHAAWFTHEHHKEGFIAFLDTIVNMPEVWLVTTTQAIEWVRDPQPLSTVNNFPPFQCNVEKAKKCNNPKVCNLWHKSGVRYMRTCQPCPEVYPWTGKTGVRNSRVDNDISEE